jgi:oligopeptide transport system permease protein
VLRHALRGGLLPVVSFSGPALAELLAGAIVVESIFSVPGLGRYFVDAANNRDHFLLLGITAFFAVALMVGSLLVDVAYAYLDPRIRYE